MTMRLEDIAAVLGVATPAEGAVSRWSIDSRTIEAGALFFALRGPNHDGNAYLGEVFARGASAAVAERAEAGRPVFVVRDSLAALTELARRARRRWGGTVVGVTGSAGKTTTKDLIAALTGVERRVAHNEGNLNNHVGLPLSILRLADEAEVAVLEMGMNHAGEIAHLASVAAPDIGVVTNAGSAHVENFADGVEGVARAKRELIEALPPAGVAVLNADDARVAGFAGAHRGRVVTYGLSTAANVRASDVEMTEEGSRFLVHGVRFETRQAGVHGVRNVLAAVAVAREFGVSLTRMAQAAAEAAAGRMRGERRIHRGVTVIDDCYNSNPEAAMAMLDVLAATSARRRIAVLGEMLELGRWAETLHREVGKHAARSSLSVLIGIRGAARHMVDEAVAAGLPHSAALFFEDPVKAGRTAAVLAQEGDAVLFKGSRGTKVERALEAFLATAAG